MAGKGDKKTTDQEKLKSALIKKALGYDAKEVIEEYKTRAAMITD